MPNRGVIGGCFCISRVTLRMQHISERREGTFPMVRSDGPRTNEKVNKTMKNRNTILKAILSLLAFGGLSCTAQAAGGAAPVNVTNTTTNPVPVTGTVNVVNTTTNPVPVTGTVGVTGTVANADNPARHAVQQQLDFVTGPTSITIPAGSIFVLETVSFFFEGTQVTLDNLHLRVTGNLITGGGQGTVDHYLVIPPPTSSGTIQGGQALRLYAQPGTTLSVFSAVGGPGSISSFLVSLSGYFVSAQ
jgi:hypothetical protein